MTDSAETSTAPEKVDPDSVELRVKPRPVTRINRRVVIGGVALKQVCLSWPTIAGCDSVS